MNRTDPDDRLSITTIFSSRTVCADFSNARGETSNRVEYTQSSVTNDNTDRGVIFHEGEKERQNLRDEESFSFIFAIPLDILPKGLLI